MLVKQLKQIGWVGVACSAALYLFGFGYYVWLLQHDFTVTATLTNVVKRDNGAYVFVLTDQSFTEPVELVIDSTRLTNFKLGDRVLFNRTINPWSLSEDTRLPRFAPEHLYDLVQWVMRWVGPTLKYFQIFAGVFGWALWFAAGVVHLADRCGVKLLMRSFKRIRRGY